MTILAEIAYAGATMLAKLTYPEPGAGLSLLSPPGDAVADVSQDNTGRTAIGGIPKSSESFAYDPQFNWNAYGQSQDGVADIAPSRPLGGAAEKDYRRQPAGRGRAAPHLRQTRGHNRDNQITKIDGSSSGVSYDDAGQMVKIPTGADLTGAPRTLVWNAWGYIRRVKDDQGTTVQANQYDALGRRLTRGDGTGTSHLYYDDQWRVVEQRRDASTDPERQYIWSPADRYTLILRDRDTTGDGTLDERLYQLKQHLDPAAVIDASGAVQGRYQFTAFGRPGFLAPDYASRASSSFAWDGLFHVELTDPETGYQNYGYRFYAPDLGRWLSRDPIGEEGGVNLYGFVGNGPLSARDLLGLHDPLPYKETCGPTRDEFYRQLREAEIREYRERLRPNPFINEKTYPRPVTSLDELLAAIDGEGEVSEKCCPEDLKRVRDTKKLILQEALKWNETSPRWKSSNQCTEQSDALIAHLVEFLRSNPSGWTVTRISRINPENPWKFRQHSVVKVIPIRDAKQCGMKDFVIDLFKWKHDDSGWDPAKRTGSFEEFLPHFPIENKEQRIQ